MASKKSDLLYSLEIVEKVGKLFSKLGKKDPAQAEAVKAKIKEVLANPHQFKRLKSPMQNMRRVHVGSFVLVYDIDDEKKVVTLRRYEHHDKAYK